jgi:catechol 2,3-dioxygenase-like lactoylglutathione lyase family enzyme
MQLLRAATLSTPDLQAAIERYEKWLDYRLVERGLVSQELAESWGAPRGAGSCYAVVQPASGASVYLRFIEGEVPREYRPLRTFGWAAIEICVQDTLAVYARLARSPFEIIGPPRELEGLPAIFPMQVRGPDQEIVFLTQIRSDIPSYDLPRAQSPIDRLFIVVLACSDLRASMRWFEDTLGIERGREMEIVYTVLANAFELPLEQKHRIATGVHGRDCFLEFDQYPPQATPRPGSGDRLKPGVALATLLHPSLDTVRGWITAPRVRNGVIYGGRRSGTLLAPDKTLVEVIDCG